MLGPSMQNSPPRSSQALASQDEPFTVQLTRKQALFLAALLPLRYSLQPQRRKKGGKGSKSTAKSRRRTNLPPQGPSARPPATRPPPPSSPIPLPAPQKPPSSPPDRAVPPGPAAETLPAQHRPQLDSKGGRGEGAEWRLQFLRECRSYPLFVKAYGGVLDLLEQRLRDGAISEEDFLQTVVSLYSDGNMRRSKRGLQVSEQLKEVFTKHRQRATSNRKTKMALNFPKPPQQKAEKKQSPPAGSRAQSRRTHSSSQSQLGVDFDLSEYECSKPVLQFGEDQFMSAAYISRNLRKIPPAEALAILSRYCIPAIDVLKIKALPGKELAALRAEVKGLKNAHPHSISDSSSSGRESVESSFEIEED